MPNDDELSLVVRFTDERSIVRRREAFLTSLVLHLVAVVLILVAPNLFPPRQSTPPLRRMADLLENSERLGYLALPPDYKRFFQRSKPPVPPPREQLKVPVIAPHGLWAPTPEKKEAQSSQLAVQKTTPTTADTTAKAPSLESPVVVRQESNPGGSLASPEAKKPDSGEGKSDLRNLVARLETPGSSIQSSLEKARKGGAIGGGGSGLTSTPRIDKRMPDFSVDEPSILSDTRGIDFTSWLRIIYFRVRDNWYAVIPEVIRSGLQGKVVVIFDVHSDGRIDNLQVIRSSGLSPYDRAAISSLKLSEPFPNFPRAFVGERLTLQFTYLYNIRL
jgi:TonB family protein